MLLHDYNWKAHYSAHMTKSEEALGFCHYQIETDSGKGEVISCTVFPGIQAVYNDLHLLRCGTPVPREDNIVEISFCVEGRYECEVNSRYCFYLGHGDLSIGTVGRMETGGGFPTRRFCGLTLFLDLTALEKQLTHVLREMEIDLDVIRELSGRQPRRFVLHDCNEINPIFLSMTAAEREHRLPMLKLKTLELLMLLSDGDFAGKNDGPVYLNRRLVRLAKDVQRRVTADLSRHFTLAQLSAEFHTSPTAIKTAFKSVYGESLRTYLKSFRLQEAQRLLTETDMPVWEIAALVGYANPGHFASAFREAFAMSPGEYKKSVPFEQQR